MVSFSVATIFALLEYRLKLKAEKRVAISQQAETDVRLIQAFTELMNIANGRGGYVTSEKLIEELFKRDVFTDAYLGNWGESQKRLGEFPLIYLRLDLEAKMLRLPLLRLLVLSSISEVGSIIHKKSLTQPLITHNMPQLFSVVRLILGA